MLASSSNATALKGRSPFAASVWAPIDWILITLVALCAFLIGRWLVQETNSVFFYQTLMPATVVAACGLGWFDPVEMSPALLSFTTLATSTFDCGNLQGVPLEGSYGSNTQVHLYLAWAASTLWRIGGLKLAALWPLSATLAGLYAAGGYALGRQFLPRAAALAIGLLLTVSPLANSTLELSIRDYSKAPFLIWAITLLVLALRARTGRSLTLLGAALGAVIGVGAGFRSDLAVMVPITLAILTFGQWRGPVRIMGRFAAVAAFLIVALALMAPLRANVQGFFGAIWLQGMSEPFRYRLRLAPAPYDLGERYSDELAYSSIGADLRRSDPAAYDAGEGSTLLRSQTQRFATAYVAGWAPLFVADIATRAIEAAWLTMGLPTLLNPSTPTVQLYDLRYPGRFSLSQVAAKPMSLIASRWTPVVGVAGFLLLLLRIYTRSGREALWFGAIVGLLAVLPSAQFALRHLFHLEVVFWLSIMALLTSWPLRHALRPALPRFAALSASATGAALLIYAGLIIAQERMLKDRVAAVLAAPSTPLPLTEEARPSGSRLLRLAVPPEHRDVVDGPFDSAVPATNHVGFHTLRSAGDRIILQIGGPSCLANEIRLRLAYALRPETWQPMTRDLVIPRPVAGWSEPTQVVMPAFYRASQYFEGFEIPVALRDCVLGARRAEDEHRLPIIFTAVLPPGWENGPMRLRFFGRLGPVPLR